MYFTVVTTTSLGYGDIYPRTGGGLVIACPLCLLGVVVLALPIAVIGGNFSNLYESYLAETSRKLLYRPAALLRRKEVEHLNASEVALSHEAKCRNLTSTIQIFRDESSSQSEKIVKVNILLSVIIERSRRLRLAKIMSQINMKHWSSLLHRSKQPASPEQAMKWRANPKLSRSGSTVNLGSNSSWSSDFSTSPPKLELLPIQSDTWRYLTKICYALNSDGPLMVPRIYAHSVGVTGFGTLI
jgi:Ion channel